MIYIEHKDRMFEQALVIDVGLSKRKRKELYTEQAKRFEHHYYACDFECTTQEPYTVYMVTIECIETHEQWLFSTIDEYFQFCEDHPNSTMYFHNGASYDFEFILNRAFKDSRWSISTGRVLTLTKRLNEYMLNSYGKYKSKDNKRVRASVKVKLLDSLDVVKGSIKSLGKSINMDKGLGTINTPLVAFINDDNTWFEQLDNTGVNFKQHSTDFDTDCIIRGWWKYAMQDTAILAEVLRQYKVIDYAIKNKTSTASIAYDSVVTSNPLYESALENERKLARKDVNYKDDVIRYNRMAKLAYKGGIAWANKLYMNMFVTYMSLHGYHLDYTSMYPSIYMNPEQYPLPKHIPCNEKTNLFIVHYKNLKCTCNENAFPLLKARTDIEGSNGQFYLHRFQSDISLTTPEYKYFKQHYTDISYDSVKVVYYKENKALEDALVAHGKKWYKIKETKSGAEKQFAKMMLNTAYGYLGFFEKEIELYKYKLLDGVMKKEKYDTSVTGMWNAEVPAASFITAYGRCKLANDINRIGVNNVVCCDTDSLFVVDVPFDELSKLVTISDNLGDLKLEHTFTRIRALKAKTWCISSDYATPDVYAKYGYNENAPLAQATAGSNYIFKNIQHFNYGETFYSSIKIRGKGGVGIKQQKKVLGEMDELLKL